MTKPVTYYPWAVSYKDYDLNTASGVQTVPNKAVPVSGDTNWNFIAFGVGYKVPVPLQYYNNALYGYSQWFQYLNGRWALGDVYKTLNVMTAGEVSQKFGYNWTYLGSVVKGYGEVHYWERIF